ncbi:MAG: 2-hydroxyacyl-CoA dehydratase subunit D [Chloroflexota bacterium]
MQVGWLCSYTPVEILTASGLRAVRLSGSAGEDARASALLPSALCPFLKSCLAGALDGNGALLAGTVVAVCCDGLRRLADIWSRYAPGFTLALDVPRRQDEVAVAYFRGRLLALADSLAAATGRPLDGAALRSAIVAHNESRRLLGELDLLRRRDIGLPAGAMLTAVQRWQQEPPAVFQAWLADYLAHLRAERPRPRGTPLVISGNVLTPEDGRVLALVEEAGGRVVGDDLCSGLRGLPEQISLEGDPYLALARAYLQRTPCARMNDGSRRREEVVRLCRETGARGVIYLSQKFCDSFLYDFGALRDELEKAGIRALLLELDGGAAIPGQIRTRIEAFLEVL